MDRLPKPYKMDVWLAKFPLSQNMKVFVATVAIVGGTGYLFFKDFKTQKSGTSGHVSVSLLQIYVATRAIRQCSFH